VRQLAPVLRERRGGVLFINSLTGLVVSRSSPVYGASKAAARMLILGVRQELRGEGVVVTTSHPGFVDTGMAERIPYPKATPEEVAERSLDGLEAEATVVFPDRLAEMVEQALMNRAAEVLSEPQSLMTELVDKLRDAQ
jgi:short-subunit dehydrogenase